MTYDEWKTTPPDDDPEGEAARDNQAEEAADDFEPLEWSDDPSWPGDDDEESDE